MQLACSSEGASKDTMPKPITHNTLFNGSNLLILCEYIADECVDCSIRIAGFHQPWGSH